MHQTIQKRSNTTGGMSKTIPEINRITLVVTTILGYILLEVIHIHILNIRIILAIFFFSVGNKTRGKGVIDLVRKKLLAVAGWSGYGKIILTFHAWPIYL